MRQTFGTSDVVEQRLRERNIRRGAWTVDLFYHQRFAAEDDLARLMLIGRVRSNSCVVRGLDQLPHSIVDLYRQLRGAELQVAFD
jgi:NADPH-dependent curcumin reductase CurA